MGSIYHLEQNNIIDSIKSSFHYILYAILNMIYTYKRQRLFIILIITVRTEPFMQLEVLCLLTQQGEIIKREGRLADDALRVAM